MASYGIFWFLSAGIPLYYSSMGPGTSRAKVAASWTPLDVREYLESREGKIWQREDTLRVLERAEQIETFIKQLMQAAGIEIVE